MRILSTMAHRRKQMAEAVGGDEMDSVRKYFNTTGFERWNKIYGETEVRGATGMKSSRLLTNSFPGQLPPP